MKVLILTLSLWYALEQNLKTLFVCLAECCDLKLFWFWNNTKTNRQKRKFSIKYLQEKYKALKAKAMRGNICIYRGGNPQAVSYPEQKYTCTYQRTHASLHLVCDRHLNGDNSSNHFRQIQIECGLFYQTHSDKSLHIKKEI